MTNHDDSIDLDLDEAASAVFDDDASAEERVFVQGHPDGPALLATYGTLRKSIRDLDYPGNDAFDQMRIRALTAAFSAESATSVQAPATTPPIAGRPVGDLASRRSLRSLGPKLIGVAAVAIVGIGAIAIANLDRDSSSDDSASTAARQAQMESRPGGVMSGDNRAAPSAPSIELAGPAYYLGSFATVDDLGNSYRLRGADLTSPIPSTDETDSGSEANGVTGPMTPPSSPTLKSQACGDVVAQATLVGRAVVLVEESDQIHVLDMATCTLIAVFLP